MTNHPCLIAAAFAAAALSPAALAQSPPPWNRCCGTTQWPAPSGMMGGGMMGGGMMGRGPMMGNYPRHRYAMMTGIPAGYRSLENPLPRTSTTIDRGRVVFEQNCAACHGKTGAGDGPTAQGLSPRPANLAWLSQMPMGQWDAYMFWTVSEGGAQFGSAMPALKTTLSKNDRWAVIAYIQAHLPGK